MLLQRVVGTLLYYSRAMDPSICTAVHELGSIQSQPTVRDMNKMEKLLQYVSKHRNIGIRYYASNMILQLITDASYLCRPRAKSVLGLHSYLGEPTFINGPLTCASKMISCVVASVADSRWISGGTRSSSFPTHVARPWLFTTTNLTSHGQHSCNWHS